MGTPFLLTTPALSWPVKAPAEVLDYVLVVDGSASEAERLSTVTDPAALCTEPMLSISVSVAPSGAGEMVPTAVYASGGAITVWLQGGLAGRRYSVSVTASTPTRVYQWLVLSVCEPALASWPLPDPVTPGFGAAAVWPPGDSSFVVDDSRIG